MLCEDKHTEIFSFTHMCLPNVSKTLQSIACPNCHRGRDGYHFDTRVGLAWDKGSHTAGLAWIITDPTRNLEIRGGQIHHNVTTPLAAEALAMRAALQATSSMKVTHLFGCSPTTKP
ncbi:hypothetical protein HID58_012216 [Brassica napus]|uniref:RNase H type-1 domain-containing protein n=1 Tax=Brassica napus TaxID=3708 RepID=A0ABQ8E0F9_BRANA|nr:hypothetical protein HID58_012216 [Brassica napus]